MAEERVPRAGDRRDAGGGIKAGVFSRAPGFPSAFFGFSLAKGRFPRIFSEKMPEIRKNT